MEGRIMWLFLPYNVSDAYHPWWTKLIIHLTSSINECNTTTHNTHTQANNILIYILIYLFLYIWQHHMRVMKETKFITQFFLLKKERKKKKNHINWTTPPKCQECFSNLMYPLPQLSPMWVLPSLSTQAIWSPLHHTHIMYLLHIWNNIIILINKLHW
jgi:hypothetical protein